MRIEVATDGITNIYQINLNGSFVHLRVTAVNDEMTFMLICLIFLKITSIWMLIKHR